MSEHITLLSAPRAQLSVRVPYRELPPGSLLSERDLAQAFGVSRPAVREAIRKLTQTGPDALGSRLVRDGQPDWAAIRSLLEARELICAQAAGAAAQRGTAALDAALADAVLALTRETLARHPDPITLQRLALRFWDRVVHGADSADHASDFDILRSVYEPAMSALAAVMVAEVGRADLYRALAGAIAARDSATARASAAALLALGTAAVTSIADAMEVVR